MKSRIIITALVIITTIVAILVLANAYDKSRYPTMENQGTGLFILFISMLMIGINSVAAASIALIKKYKKFALLPLLIILGSCAVSLPVGGIGYDARISDFKANQVIYDEIVGKVIAGDIGDVTRDEIPDEYRKYVSYAIRADREGTNVTAVRLVLYVAFPNHHSSYLWDPDGVFTNHMQSWARLSTVITTNWCVIND